MGNTKNNKLPVITDKTERGISVKLSKNNEQMLIPDKKPQTTPIFWKLFKSDETVADIANIAPVIKASFEDNKVNVPQIKAKVSQIATFENRQTESIKKVERIVPKLILKGKLKPLLPKTTSNKTIEKQIKENPPINEKMIRAMYAQMGRKPSEAQIRQIMKTMGQ